MTLNRILTDKDREKFSEDIQEMWGLCPEMMGRKLTDANVQQAFVYNTVKMLATKQDRILCVGSFEDTACESLKALGYKITEIDPDINGLDLEAYFSSNPEHFDIIFSTSVLEHVKYDNSFIAQICYLLNEGGIAVLTCDFKDDYKEGDPLPYSDQRFYTRNDLEVRLCRIIEHNDCKFVSTPDWSGKDRFIYQGHQYSFATLVFSKDSNV